MGRVGCMAPVRAIVQLERLAVRNVGERLDLRLELEDGLAKVANIFIRRGGGGSAGARRGGGSKGSGGHC